MKKKNVIQSLSKIDQFWVQKRPYLGKIWNLVFHSIVRKIQIGQFPTAHWCAAAHSLKNTGLDNRQLIIEPALQYLWPKGRYKLIEGPVPNKDMQTPPPALPPLSFDPIFMEDAQCAETNEKSIFRFLFLSYHENSSKIGVIWVPPPLLVTMLPKNPRQ